MRDLNKPCPQCGGELTFGFGLAGGGCGAYVLCLDCDFFEKPLPTVEEGEEGK